MSPVTGIIKNSQVKPAGRARLSGGRIDRDGDAAAVEAHLLASDDTNAVIEVVCSCGRRLEIVCEYAPADGGEADPQTPQEQDQAQQ